MRAPSLQDGLDDVRARVGEARQVHVALVSEHIVENEKRVIDGGALKTGMDPHPL
jgi:hypothetical protein